MLFEVFFNPLGVFRDEPKVARFNEVFQLQQFPQLAAGFEFISECLLPHAGRFYAAPGKAHTIAVHVSIGPGRKRTPIVGVNSGFVDAVTLSGVNILWLEDEDYKVTDPADQNIGLTAEVISRRSFAARYYFRRTLRISPTVRP